MEMSASDTKLGPEPPRAPRLRPGPAGGARERNRRARAASITSAALRLFLDRGIDDVSIDQIAKAAGIGKATFYAYFTDLQELVGDMLAPFRANALGAMDRCHDQLRVATDFGHMRLASVQLGTELYGVFVANLDVLRLLLQESRGPGTGARGPVRDLYDELVERAVQHNQTALERGLIRPIHPRVSALVNLGAAERLTVGFLRGDDLGDPGAAVRSLVEVLLAGLRPAATRDRSRRRHKNRRLRRLRRSP
jgi:AcrR family transcriptional regulator